MKKLFTIIVAITLLGCNACKKEEVKPQSDLLGVWRENKGHLHFVIRNTKNEGFNVKYLEYMKDQDRMLKVTVADSSETYKVEFVNKYELFLRDEVDSLIAMHKTNDIEH